MLVYSLCAECRIKNLLLLTYLFKNCNPKHNVFIFDELDLGLLYLVKYICYYFNAIYNREK